jgi:hypothetical protein
MKSSSNCPQLILSVGLTLGLLSGLLSQTPVLASWLAQAPSTAEVEPNSSQPFRLRPIPEAELRRMVSRGGASRRGRAGTRGDCPAVDAAAPGLTAIDPVSQGMVDSKAVEIPVGTTTSAYPTFWFYLPYANEALGSVRFVVNNEAEMPLFEPIEVPLSSQTPGLVAVQLPPSAPALEVGKYYHWYVLVDCAPESGSDAFVDAFVQRLEITPELQSELETAAPTERVDLLLQNNIWHEAMDQLYLLQSGTTSPEVQQKWRALLAAGGLVLPGSK